VLLGVLYGEPSIVVDTHFARVARRIGFTSARQPERIEREMSDTVPEEIRTDFSMVLNFHGRYVCTARKPQCYRCPVERLCAFPDKILRPLSEGLP
jgi:endonuclease-3